MAEQGSFDGGLCNVVLVVEDDPDIRETIRDLLIDEGYRVETAANGELGVAALRRASKPCFVLLDMMMPVLDGAGFLERVRKDAELSAQPVLIVSAVATSGHAGAVGALRKPIDIDVLLQWVQRYCARPA